MAGRTIVAGFLGAALLAAGCRDAVSPERRALGAPQLDAVAGSGIAFDTLNSTLNQRGDFFIKGFNPRSPHPGDAIIVSVFWVGSTNIIDSVTDHIARPGFPPVGNKYNLVEYVTAGGISMATYVATNVQNYPYPTAPNVDVLAVRANLSTVASGGIMMAAWSGVDGVFTQAMGAHRSGSGAASSEVLVGPGAIPVNAGALAYAVTMSNGMVGRIPPAGFGNMLTLGDGTARFVTEADTAVQANVGSVDPQWRWFYQDDPTCTPATPCTWLASVLALNPAAAGTPPGDLTVTTNTTGSSLDRDGYMVAVDGGPGQPIASNNSTGVTFTGLAAGSHTVALSGVATNCSVSGGNSRTVTVSSGGTVTASFVVICAPPTGDLTVATRTSGLSLDLNGYTVTVDWNQSEPVATNGSVTFTGLDAGDHTVVLSGVALNCTVSGGDTQTVTVPAGSTASTTFTVTCVPGPATGLMFTVQPSNTTPNATISPAVKAKAVDAQGNTVTTFAGPVTIAIGRNGSLLLPGVLSGTATVTPTNGVATFSDLRIDKSGDGYTLRVTAAGLTGAESAQFNVRALVCVLGVCL